MADTKARSKLPEGMRLRGKVYYAWFKHQGREVRKRLSADLKVATGLFHDLRARLERGDWGMLDNDCSWKEIKDQFLAVVRQSLRSAKDIETDINRFERFRSVLSVKQITHAYVIAYRQWRLAQRIGKPPVDGKPDTRPFVTARTVNKEVGTLRNMLNKAVEWKLIGSNPIKKVDPLKHDEIAKERRALSIEEVNRLFAVAPDYLLPILRFMMTTGVRRDEAVELRWSDIDFERRTVSIRATIAKSGKGREIPLDDEMIEILGRLRVDATSREAVPGTTRGKTAQQAANFSRDHVFVTKANTPWRNNLLKRFYLYAQRAGIEDAHPRGAVDLHSLRGTFVTHAIDHGASPKAVQEIVGHSTLTLTMKVYAKSTDRAKRAAIAALPFAKVTTPSHVIPITTEQKGGGYKPGTRVPLESQDSILQVVNG